MHKIILKTLSVIITSVVMMFFSTGVAFAAKPAGNTSALLGNDISWPQCNKTLPAGQAFGIVGVNNGLANNTNPCLATQLAWAAQSKGGTGQPLAALYVNTANPGLASSSWPTSNYYGGQTVSSPYGTCNGADNAACAYMYGYAKAYDDVNIRGVSNPSSYFWWLDVETANSWETNKAANAADLEGMAAYFKSVGAQVGLYSTASQWGQIVGTASTTSNLNGLVNWRPGGANLSTAKQACTATPLTTGGKVTLTQYVSQNLDYDYSCI